jgi:hypothetical protein
MIKNNSRAALLGACFAVLSPAARAGTFDLSYTGIDAGNGITVGTTTGTGSFDLSGGKLTAFSLTLFESVATGQTDTFTWDLSDVANFNYTLAGGNFTALAFSTDYKPGFYTLGQNFSIIDLLAGDAFTSNGDLGPITIGSLTVTPQSTTVPEPVSAMVLGVGLAGVVITKLSRSLFEKRRSFF